MPPVSTLPVFVTASLALLLIPGPAVLFIVARSSSQGPRAGAVSVLGVHSASAIHVLAAVAGLSAVVVASSIAFTTIKLIGGFYLIYLGVRSIRGARHVSSPAAPSVTPEKRLFVEAFTVNLLNPKVAIFFLAFIPQFVDDKGPLWSQTLVLGLIYIALGLCSDSMYVLLGSRVGTLLGGCARRARKLRYTEGGILIGLGVLTFALPHRRSTR